MRCVLESLRTGRFVLHMVLQHFSQEIHILNSAEARIAVIPAIGFPVELHAAVDASRQNKRNAYVLKRAFPLALVGR
jgi:hypothetical protein